MKTVNSKETQQILDTFIEVELPSDKFLVVKETLTRIGVCSRNKPVLYQSCHILSLHNKYYITHFKELFLLDDKESTLDQFDINRRNQIAKLLQDWGLVRIINPGKFPVEEYFIKMIKIVSSKDKDNWDLVPKYHLGSKSSFSSKENNKRTDKKDDLWTNYNY